MGDRPRRPSLFDAPVRPDSELAASSQVVTKQMTIFDMSLIGAPILGAVGGGEAAEVYGTAGVVVGALLGLGIGIAVHLVGDRLGALIVGRKKPQFLFNVVAGMILCWASLSPGIAWLLSQAVVAKLIPW